MKHLRPSKYFAVLTILILLFMPVKAQWISINNGLTDNYIYSMAISGSNMFAGTGGGFGVFLSTDYGTTWSLSNSGLTNATVRSIVVQGTDIFAGTGDGVYHSTNNGASWTASNSGLTNTNVFSLVFASNGMGGTTLFAGTFGGGVFLSTNNGTSWNAVNTGMTSANVNAIEATPNGIGGSNLFSSTTNGLFRSTDNGTNWTTLDLGIPFTDVRALTAISDNIGNTFLFAGTYGYSVLRSSDNGTSWTQVNTRLMTGSGQYIQSFATSSTNLFAGTSDSIFVSTNYGATWDVVSTGLTPGLILSINAFPDGSGETNIFAGIQGLSLWRRPLTEMVSTGSAPVAAYTATPVSGSIPLSVSFTDQSTGNPTSWKWYFGDGDSSSLQNPSHIYSSAGSYTVVFKTANAFGSNTSTKSNYISATEAPTNLLWKEQSSGVTTALAAIHFVDTSKGWAVGQDGIILATVDGGAIWTKQTSPTTNWLSTVYFITASHGWTAGDGGKLLETTDGGTTWTEKTSPSSTTITSLFFLNESQGWLTNYYGYIYKTTDGGSYWSFQTNPTSNYLRDIFFVSSTQGYAAGIEALLTTTNGGSIWTSHPSGSGNSYKSIHFPSSSLGYVAGDVIQKTTDGGISWTTQTKPITDAINGVWFVDDNTGWAVANSAKIITTTNGGANWTEQSSNLSGTYLADVYFVDKGHGWAVSGNGKIIKYWQPDSIPHSVGAPLPFTESFENTWVDKDDIRDVPSSYWKSTPPTGLNSWSRDDDGVNRGAWGGLGGSYLPAGVNGTTHSARFHTYGASSQSKGSLEVALNFSSSTANKQLTFSYINPDGADSLYIYLSIDGGNTFGNPIAQYDTSITWRSIKINLGNSVSSSVILRFTAVSDYGYSDIGIDEVNILTTSSELTWIKQTSNTTKNLGWVHFINLSTGWITGDGGTILKTTNGGTTWSAQTSPISDDLYAVFFTDSEYGWAVGGYAKIINTTDGGATWTQQTSGTTNRPISLYFTDRNNGWICGDAGTVLHTTNGGANWTTQTSHTSEHLSDIHFESSSIGWAGGQHGTVIATTDGGANWTVQTTGVSSEVYHFGNMDFVDATHGWVVGGQGTVVRTTDGGVNWTSSVTSPTDTLWFVDFIDQQEGYTISIEGDMYHSTDGGVNWATVKTGIANRRFYSLFFVDKNNGWLTGDSGSIYRYGTGSTGIQNRQDNVQQEFTLLQNYPNPFNPSTMIAYSIPKSSQVVVRIYNLIGQQIATLMEGYKEAGRHSIVFNAGKLSSGIYIYHISAGNYSAVKKMTLIK